MYELKWVYYGVYWAARLYVLASTHSQSDVMISAAQNHRTGQDVCVYVSQPVRPPLVQCG